jgi:hypothetical protein
MTEDVKRIQEQITKQVGESGLDVLKSANNISDINWEKIGLEKKDIQEVVVAIPKAEDHD